MRRTTLLAGLLLCLLLPAIATAQSEPDAATRAVARDLGLAGINLYKAGKFAEAFDKLTRAHELVGLTTTGLWRARCLVALGRLVEGSEALLEVSRMTLTADAKAVHVEAQRSAAREHQEIQQRIPRLLVNIVGEIPSDTEVLLDDKVVKPALFGVAQPLDPGKHVLEVRGSGLGASKEIVLEEGQAMEVPIRLVSSDPGDTNHDPFATDSAEPVVAAVGWVAIALGAGGLIAGAITGGLALNEKSELDESCPERRCEPDFHDQVDELYALRTASTVCFIAGGIVAGAGIALVLSAPVFGDDVGVVVSPTGLMVRGAF